MKIIYKKEIKLKALKELKYNNFKNISEKMNININTLKSWYYKNKKEEFLFSNHKKDSEQLIIKTSQLINKIKLIFNKNKANSILSIEKIRKKHNLSLKIILIELNISKSNYYYRLNNFKRKKEIEERKIHEVILIYDIFKESRKQFGYRRIKSELFKKHNILMNFKKIIKLMKSFSMIVGYLNRRQRKNKHLVGKNRFNVPDLIKRGFNKIKNRFII